MEIQIEDIDIKEKVSIEDIEIGVKTAYPELENLVVNPTGEEQHFKSNMYGYDEVTVKGVESDEINITPSTEEQIKEGLYKKVTVPGASDLIPENIVENKEIFGVIGNAKTTDIRITNASYLFYNNARLDYLYDILKLCKNVTSISNMFYGCYNLKELDLSNFDTSNAADMSYMFNNCYNLKELDLSNFNTSNATNISYILYACNGLTELDLSNFDTQKTTNFNNAFGRCTQLKKINLSSFDMSKAISIGSMFLNDESLEEINSFKNLGKGYTRTSNNYSSYKLDLSACNKLTYESLIDIITNGLYDLNLTYDVANGGTLYRQQLILGAINLAKLTAEEIAIATNKGWNVS